MDRYHWFFRENGGTANADNIAGKIFSNDFSPLVRESIQNSLDAAITGLKQPVIVTYRFGKLELPAQSPFLELEKWVDGGMVKFSNPEKRIYKNLKSIKETLAEIKRKGYVCYLEVSDENTTGMDYTQDKRLQSNTRFYSFLKSLGNSSKGNSTTSQGSHGVGKVVFQKLSKLNTIFVSSKLADDGTVLFEGASELCTSLIDGTDFEYRGYFCMDDTQEPTNRHEDIPQLFRRSADGTSVYVMGVSDDIEHQKRYLRDIEKAVVENFWLSILEGKLIVKIGETTIEKKTIIDLAEKVYSQPELYGIKGKSDIRKYIEAVYLADTDNKHIHITDSSVPELGEVHLYVLKDKHGDNCIQYMRGSGMTIKTESHPNYGFYGVFVCKGDAGNENLRNSENPEHNKWSHLECDNKIDSQNANRAIRGLNKFITQQLINIFGGDSTGKSDISGAEEFLYMNVSSEDIEDPEMEVILGKPKEEVQEKESQVQTTIFERSQEPKTKQERHGHIVVEENCTASMNDEGDLHGGRGTNPHEPTPGPPPPPIPANDKKYKQDEEGNSGVFSRPISVHYRPFFQKKENVVYHYVNIIPNEDCVDATVELIVKGDEDNDNIYIESVSQGIPVENRISGLVFTKGIKQLLEIKFEDNLPHPITLKAYEYKK